MGRLPEEGVNTPDNIDPSSYSQDTWLQLVPRLNWFRHVSDDGGGAGMVPVVRAFFTALTFIYQVYIFN